MRRFVYLLLFIFAPGYALLENRGCGGKISIFRERSGFIRYPSHPDRSIFNQITDNSTDVPCTWIIDSHENQTVWIEVISIGNNSSFGIQFGNKDERTNKKDDNALFSGTGRTIIKWRTAKSTDTLHLRWNTSDSSHDPALIPYTHSDTDPVSPSPSGSSRVTYTPDIPGKGNTALESQSHTPRGESVQWGEGVSDLADNSRPRYPQENTNNEQETTGEWISDLSGTNSYSSTTIRPPSLSLHTTPKHTTSDVTAKTITLLSHTSDVTHTESHKSSQRIDTNTFTKMISNTLRAKRSDPSSVYPTDSFLSVSLPDKNTTPFSKKDFFTDSPHKVATLMQSSVLDVLHTETPTYRSETDKPDRLSMSTHPNVNIYNNSITVTSTPEFPAVNQSNPLKFSDSNTYSGHTKSFDFIGEPTMNVTILSTTENNPTTSSILSTKESPRTHATQDLTSEASTTHIIKSQPNKTSSISTEISELTSHNNEASTFTIFTSTTPPSLTSAGTDTESDCLTCTSYVPSTVRQNKERQENLTTTPPSGSSSPEINPNVTSDLASITTVTFRSHVDLKEPEISPSQIQNVGAYTNSPQAMLSNTPKAPLYNPTSPSFINPQTFSVITQTSIAGVSTRRSLTAITKTIHGLSPLKDAHTESIESMDSITSHLPGLTLSPSSVDLTSSTLTISNPAVQTSTPVSITSSPAYRPPTKQSKMTPHATSAENPSVRTHIQVVESRTIRPTEYLTTSFRLTGTNQHAASTQEVTQTSQIQSTASKSDKKWPHGRHFVVVEDQQAIIKKDTFQVLLQITLEDNFDPGMGLHEMEPFLQRVSGYKSQHVTWHSGPVLQTVVLFQTVRALSWLGRAESLLQEVGLNPVPKAGIFLGGVRVKNIIVGGLQTEICEWLFECPAGFQCVSSKTNASCTSVCHFDYCKNQGICVHRPDQQPICQCPVGEDYWFMGQRCDLRMTRPRLVGVCFGVLTAVAAVMALLSYLAVRRYKSMLMQAKVEQTRSSYRRFNHFDELSARFWGRSWPGSEDSLDNPIFTRSDELLHLRALDRTCCYHDDTLSVVSTYHGSGTNLNTVYPHSSQYGWDMSNCSLADGVVDSGKASDLSVCSWPIEPIQWTPFPLLQQINRNSASVKATRPRSYCEGMELVDLEKSWTA
ncbi:uncharacterized protein [Paramisgurnus dabryanus]|uniref:uncharacterized protein n=1 Tax=Paramisgurnus dabryanus TaxID=90735 RepID=UPI0031F43FC0